MRPNYAQDAPPTELTVGGHPYACDVDYRTWIEVMRLMREINPDAETPDQLRRNVDMMEQMQTLIFGGVLADEDAGDTLRAIIEFSRGYPSAPKDAEADEGEAIISLEWDINYIIIAIRNQSGIDLSYRRREPFHWWEFLLELQTLCGEHYIINLMEARSYKGKDRDLLRRKRACALPVEYTAQQRAAMDAFNAEFEGG